MARLARYRGPAKLREQGVATDPRCTAPHPDRTAERSLLAPASQKKPLKPKRRDKRLATNRDTRLSELGRLDSSSFRLFLTLLGEALASQTDPTSRGTVDGDGTLIVRLVPLAAHTEAEMRRTWGLSAVATIYFSFVEPSACQPPAKDVLKHQEAEERERALRALLMRPLMPAGDPALEPCADTLATAGLVGA